MIENLFFELIQVAIGKRICLSHTPNADEWGKLYAMAKKQSLVGVCFAGVRKLVEQRHEPPEMTYLTWMGMAAKIQQRNEVVNRQCVDLQKRLAGEGIGSCVLKGQGVGILYKVSNGSNEIKKVSEGSDLSLLRQSGDIDLYVDCGMERALEYVQKVAPTNEVNHKHVQLHCFEDTEVELHYIPAELHCPWQNHHLQAFFAEWNAKERVSLASGQEIMVPCQEFQVVHLLTHAYRHLFGAGIGLRQVMDLYFVLKTLSTSPLKGESVAAIKNVVHDAGMDRFASAMMWVLNKVFGLGMIGVPWVANPRDGEFLLSEIMMAGNFGHYDERIDKKGESRWGRFWRVTKQNFRLWRFSPWEVICTPLWRIWHFVWMRRRGFTQG